MPDEMNRAEDAVAESSGAYGGPASEEQLAEVYLPDGESRADGESSSSNTTIPQSRSDSDAPDEVQSAPE